MEISPEDLEQFKKDLRILKLKMQETNDILEGGIRSVNLKEFRNTYVINAEDSLDLTYPMYVHFNIISEMIKIVSVKLSFWLLPYRAYCNNAGDETFGIHEEDNSPTIKFYISENNGISYNDTFFGGYTTDKADIEITSILTSAGSKLIRFTSDVRARLSVQIEIKLDIRAR